MTDWKAYVRRRLSPLGLTPAREEEVAEELAQHLEQRYQALLSTGLSPAVAARRPAEEGPLASAFAERMAALRQAGQAATEPAAGGRWSAAGLALDVRHVLRSLRRDWGVALAAVVTLALAIGANAAVFTAVHAIVLRPLAYRDAGRIVNVWLTRAQRANWHFHVPPDDFAVIDANNHVFDRVALYDTEPRTLGAGAPEEIVTGIVSAGLFPLLDVPPALGRAFDADDEASGGRDVVILSDDLWRRRFAANASVLGVNLTLGDRQLRVVGVMPKGFAFPAGAEAWIPRDRTAAQSNAYMLGRLRPGVRADRAQADMDAMVGIITNGRSNPGMRFVVEPLKDTVTGQTSTSWLLLFAAVGCVFAIGCVNVMNLLLARGLRRQPEIDLRLALGASGGRIVRLLAIESLVLAGSGGLIAVTVAVWIVGALRAWAPADTPRLDQLVIEPGLLCAAVAASSAIAFVCGLTPATRVVRMTLTRSLKAGGAGADATPRRARARDALVVLEVALACVLLAGAMLLVRSLLRLTHVDPGFTTERLLSAELHLPAARYPHPAQQLDVINRILVNVRSQPGVVQASASTGSVMTGLGLIGAQRTLLQRLTRPDAAPGGPPEEANLRRIDAAYFDTLGMRLVAGRKFDATDAAAAARVAVINRTMARGLWGTDAVLGKRLAFDRAAGQPIWREIVGIAADTRDIAPSERPAPTFYIPLAQSATGVNGETVSLLIRTSGDPADLADLVRAQIRAVDPAQPVATISTIEGAVDRYVAPSRFRTGLLSGLALIGLVLALTGVYAVMSSAVNQRLPEMAVRLALGADARVITRLVVGRGLSLAAAGIAPGIALSLVGARAARSLLFEISPLDPLTLCVVPAVVLAVVAAGCAIPARRAAMVDPVRTLR
jgi:predicted permease